MFYKFNSIVSIYSNFFMHVEYDMNIEYIHTNTHTHKNINDKCENKNLYSLFVLKFMSS